ncbi:MAG: LacI family transcriptional regulator [Clostridia bacterium]|nr:LacI family transcriptional regulator [Clostridia bacterium]
MGVTVKDVARSAGVSTATVSRVINGDSRISGETRKRVLQCIAELGYKINNIARSLKTNKTYTVGFICPELPNSFFMNIAKGVEDELKKHGYSMIICNSNESAEQERERIDLLLEKCIDGVIIIPASDEGMHYNRFKEMNIPVVLADRLTEDFVSDSVLVDNVNGAYSAVEHLINNGERRIGYIGGDLRLTTARERDEGFRRAMRDYCIPIDESLMKYGDFHIDSGYEKMKELMELDEPPRYVFISNYFMHIGATKFLFEKREQLKSHITIASFDDIDLSSILGFCRILVGQPVMDIGSKTAQLLLSRINGEELSFPQIIRLKTHLTIL